MGEFNIDNYVNFVTEDNQAVLWILFIFISFFSTVVVFNMLVALMGETLGKLQEERAYSLIVSNFRLMSYYDGLFNFISDTFAHTQYSRHADHCACRIHVAMDFAVISFCNLHGSYLLC